MLTDFLTKQSKCESIVYTIVLGVMNVNEYRGMKVNEKEMSRTLLGRLVVKVLMKRFIFKIDLT